MHNFHELKTKKLEECHGENMLNMYTSMCKCVCVCVEIFIYIVQLDSRQHIINGAR